MSNQRNEHLAALAGRFVDEVKAREAFADVSAWAITGSVARGQASAGSDLELWAMVPRARQTEYHIFEGEPVTIFFESMVLLLDLTYLVSVEAEHLQIICDPQGEFARVKQLAEDSLPRLIRFSKKEIQRELFAAEDEIDVVAQGTLASLGAHYRKTKALILWAAHKQNVRINPAPKFYGALFGEELSELFTQALRLHLPIKTLAASLRENWPKIQKHYEQKSARLPFPLEQTSMHKKIQGNERAGALLATRTFLDRHFQNVPDDLKVFELLAMTAQVQFRVPCSEAKKKEALLDLCGQSAKYNGLIFDKVR